MFNPSVRDDRERIKKLLNDPDSSYYGTLPTSHIAHLKDPLPLLTALRAAYEQGKIPDWIERNVLPGAYEWKIIPADPDTNNPDELAFTFEPDADYFPEIFFHFFLHSFCSRYGLTYYTRSGITNPMHKVEIRYAGKHISQKGDSFVEATIRALVIAMNYLL